MIRFENISFCYDEGLPVLDGVSAQVPAGQLVCVLGANGSGKSTLAKHVNALLLPDQGTVTVAGMDTSQRGAVYDIRRVAGMVFQNPDDQLVASTVEDDVAFGPENLGLPPAQIARRVEEALAQVGLAGFGSRPAHGLSGGQKQRVAIAGVLAMRPRILVLDEATSMLDPRGRGELLAIIRQLNDQGMTVMMITQSMEEAALAQRVLVLDQGRIVLDGAPREVLADQRRLEALGLQAPFAVRMSHLLRDRGVEAPICVSSGELAAWLADRVDRAGCFPVADAEGENADGGVAAPGAGADGESAGDAESEGEAGTEAESDSLIGFRNVSFRYGDDGPWALDGISLGIRRGEFLGIAGISGSGKSTLAQHMNGILSPTKGSMAFGECAMRQKQPRINQPEPSKAKPELEKAQPLVGLMFQYPEQQLFCTTVAEEVAFGPRNLGLSDDEARQRAREALALVGLDYDQLAQRSPFELSGGQQRRIAFADVLAMNPEVLVLDEPAAGLDPRAKQGMLRFLQRLQGEGVTIVMASHSMDDLAAVCDRICVLDQGRIAALGTPRQVFTSAASAAALQSIGLEVPQAQALALRLAKDGFPLDATTLYDEDSLADTLAASLR